MSLKVQKQGRIIKGIGGFYYVKSDKDLYECKARGVFRKDNLTPLPGDRVSIEVINEDKKIGSIKEILPRKNRLIRPAVANVDLLILVTAARSPEPDLLLLDKLLVTAGMKDIDVLICINKKDLDPEGAKLIEGIYGPAGYNVLSVSGLTGEGIEDFKAALRGNTCVFSGQSGVGKSTLLNLLKQEQVMETGALSRKIDHGRHTTRHAEMFELSNESWIVDTPGFSSFEVEDLKAEDLKLFYPEFNVEGESCRFKGCSHISEPDCVIKELVEKGLIDKGRYGRYCELYRLLKSKKEW